jgi:predicted phosphoribosyltransferase/pimeloyl-ACP methyl ester carboxylesterase
MFVRPVFRDRREAGRVLAGRLERMGLDDPVVVGLPRGGVPVAFEVARALGAPLDIGLVRKLGAPGHEELGVGAIGEDGTIVLDSDTIAAVGMTRAELDAVVAREAAELDRRRVLYRGDLAALDVAGRAVVIVDDGLATGVTAVAAARVMRERGAKRVTIAVPVCPPGSADRLAGQCDELVCVEQPRRFGGVGAWYRDFTQTADEEVVALLRAAREPDGEDDGDDSPPTPRQGGSAGQAHTHRETSIRTRDGVDLPATIGTPPRDTRGLVIFVHGSGSGRLSPRNVAVARDLERQGFATLLFDLLTPAEARDRRNVFDVGLLAQRLLDVTRWVGATGLRELPVGYFGASTGAGAALVAAAALGGEIGAVVSRGGRPDLAGDALGRVTAPTLLIVGGDDWNVLELNDEAANLLGGPHELAVVPGAGHLFEEPGALDAVTHLAADWFARHLRPDRPG